MSKQSNYDKTINRLEQHPEEISKLYKNLIKEEHKPIKKEIDGDNSIEQDYIHNTLEYPKKNIVTKPKFSFVRLLLVLTVFSLATLNSYYQIMVPVADPLETKDYVLEYFSNWNEFIIKNNFIRQLSFDITAFIQDLSFITLSLFWIIKGKSWKIIISMFLFFFTKVICTITFTFKEPKGYIWDGPSFPSITFPKESEWNFFYSGLIGFNFFCFEFLNEYKSMLAKFISILALLNSIFQCGFFLSLRSNYSIDVLSNIFIAHYFYYLSDYFDCYFQMVYRLNSDEHHIKQGIAKDEILLKRKSK